MSLSMFKIHNEHVPFYFKIEIIIHDVYKHKSTDMKAQKEVNIKLKHYIWVQSLKKVSKKIRKSINLRREKKSSYPYALNQSINRHFQQGFTLRDIQNDL